MPALRRRVGQAPSANSHSKAAVAREVAANPPVPVVKHAVHGEVVVVAQCGLLKKDAGIAARTFAIGQNVAVAVPARRVGEPPLRAAVAGLQAFGKAFLACACWSACGAHKAHDAPAPLSQMWRYTPLSPVSWLLCRVSSRLFLVAGAVLAAAADREVDQGFGVAAECLVHRLDGFVTAPGDIGRRHRLDPRVVGLAQVLQVFPRHLCCVDQGATQVHADARLFVAAVHSARPAWTIAPFSL